MLLFCVIWTKYTIETTQTFLTTAFCAYNSLCIYIFWGFVSYHTCKLTMKNIDVKH